MAAIYASFFCISQLVHAFVSSKLDYCKSLLYGLPDKEISKKTKKQNIRWVLGRLNFHWVGETNPLGWVPVGLLQRGVSLEMSRDPKNYFGFT